jgi:hypothetical protein
MKLFFEPSFPTPQLSFLAQPYVTAVRADAKSLTDVALVRKAASLNCNGIVFLGRQALGRRDVIRAVRDEHVCLIATETYNPIDAIDYLRDNMGSIIRLMTVSEALLIQSESVVSVELENVASQPG